MKTILVALLLLLASSSTRAQQLTELKNVSRHVGDSVSTVGKVYGIKTVSNGELTLVSLGEAYPNQVLTVVVSEEIKKGLKVSLDSLEGKEVLVRGRVTLYNGKPQIVLLKAEQLLTNVFWKVRGKDNQPAQ
jgi:exonuclease VII large subunit